MSLPLLHRRWAGIAKVKEEIKACKSHVLVHKIRSKLILPQISTFGKRLCSMPAKQKEAIGVTYKTCLRSVASGRQRGEEQRKKRNVLKVHEHFEQRMSPDHARAVRY
ncbi:MAG: hypothetical protein V4488_19135 [Pseudomonadota bacterium]